MMKNPHKLMQEIESLKIVLDLKAGEMHSLRKKNMEMLKEVMQLYISMIVYAVIFYHGNEIH